MSPPSLRWYTHNTVDTSHVEDGVDRCATTYWVWAEGIGLPLWPSSQP
jgi:hypothetical protein